jgi:hypothetical protein
VQAPPWARKRSGKLAFAAILSGLHCLADFDLQVTRFEPEHLGKMEFYLEAIDRDVKNPHKRPATLKASGCLCLLDGGQNGKYA